MADRIMTREELIHVLCLSGNVELRSKVLDHDAALRARVAGLESAIAQAHAALLEGSQATLEYLKQPGRMNGLNVHCRRAHEAMQSALSDPIARGRELLEAEERLSLSRINVDNWKVRALEAEVELKRLKGESK